MHALDPKNELTHEVVLSSRAFAANANSAIVATKNYIGKIAFILNAAAATAGTNPTADFYFQDTEESNGANSTNINVAYTQVTNATAGVQVVSVDTRAVKSYLKVVGAIGGTNSPSFPVGITACGTKQSQS